MVIFATAIAGDIFHLTLFATVSKGGEKLPIKKAIVIVLNKQ